MESYIYIYIHLYPQEKIHVRLIFVVDGDKNPQTIIFLECTPRQKCVENYIGWPRTLGLSCPEKLSLMAQTYIIDTDRFSLGGQQR